MGLARFGTEQVIRFVVLAFLARLLTPADFGPFALALVTGDIGRNAAGGRGCQTACS